MATLNLTDVRKSFGATDVIKGVDIEIEDGEFVVFVGPSGCGKSTLLRMISGLEDITSGKLEIDGKVVNDLPPKDRGIAMVFQTYAIFPHMTVRENVAFGLTINKVDKATKEKKVAEAARILQMEHLLDRRPSQLSGGQRQRVAIGRAIVRDPKVFLFDEPLSNLDAALRMDMRLEIGKLHQDLKATMIYVTHDQVEAMTLADKIVVLANKGIAQMGSPLDLYERPDNEFVAQFIGSPAMNLLPGEIAATGKQTAVNLHHGHDAVADVETQTAEKGWTVNVGVRPEDFRIAAEGDHVFYEGTVDYVEALGEVTLLYFKAQQGQEPLIAKLPGIHGELRGATVKLTADPDKVQIFHEGKSLRTR